MGYSAVTLVMDTSPSNNRPLTASAFAAAAATAETIVASMRPVRESCSICLDGIGTCPLLIRCGHVFHEKCLLRWLREGNLSCPVCRTTYDWQEAFDIASTAHSHRLFTYERLCELILPDSSTMMIQEENASSLGNREGCRCIVCRKSIDDVLELFIPSGLCRHFLHVECALDYFFMSTRESHNNNTNTKMIQDILVETNYCRYCVQTLDLNTYNRLYMICKLLVCRYQC